MKGMKKILAVLLSAILLCAFSIQAAAGYKYTVRFYAGGQGTFDGEEVLTFEGLEYGQRVSFNQNMVTLNNGSKYYIKGIRESGKDNSTADGVSFLVEGDRDYVVAYGLLSNAVAYTIQYVDENGNEVAPSETFYGNVGDKPVVAYLYIEGYQPQAYKLTKTLSADASQNIFPFVYRAVQQPQNPGQNPGDGTGTNPGQNPGDGTGTNPGQQPDDQAGGAAETAPDGTDTTPEGQGQEDGQEQEDGALPDTGEGSAEPEELDDLDVPLADAGDGGIEDAGAQARPNGWMPGLSGVAIALICLVAAAAVGIGGVRFVKVRRKKEKK